MICSLPRLMIAAIRGGAGKTVLSLGMAAAWKGRGLAVSPFKKGPDYIDAAWLGRAAGRPCCNLDTYLMGAEQVARSFIRYGTPEGTSLIEGNRGLYDGMDLRGSHSSAELAKLLRTPVILVIDCQKITRTAAAIVVGCQAFDREVDIRGVILNRVATLRQENLVREAVTAASGLPVYGAVPRLERSVFPERHLGLTPPEEHDSVETSLAWVAGLAERYLDLDGLRAAAGSAAPLEAPEAPVKPAGKGPLTVGVIRDAAFQFYYPENLRALEDRGARLVEISALEGDDLPAVNALYIGGGFPETQARRLSENEPFRRALRRAVDEGLPVYAECGGLMYLGESLSVGRETWPMTGALPVAFGMETKPQGHGYTLLEVGQDNPFYPRGLRIRGHEFHYSRILSVGSDVRRIFHVQRGSGIGGGWDGLCRRNILALYSHVHAAGTPAWADGLAGRAREYEKTNMEEKTCRPLN